MNHRSS